MTTSTVGKIVSSNGVDPSNVSYLGVAGAVPFVLKSAIPFIHASSGSMGNNGALTGLTALPTTYSGGAWVLYPAGAIAAGIPAAPAWLWTVFSSATAGTVFNSTYTSGMPTLGAATAFVTTGPGAFTGDITERAGPTIAIPAGAIGPNGRMTIDHEWAATNNANAKTSTLRFSGAAGTLLSQTAMTSDVVETLTTRFSNRGAQNVNWGVTTGVSTGASVRVTARTDPGIDTSVATSVVLAVNKGTATDNHILESWAIRIEFGA